MSNADEIRELNPDEKFIHLAFRPSNKHAMMLTDRCKKLKLVQIPHSHFGSLSSIAVQYLEAFGVEVIEGDVWGHRKDLSEYYEVSGVAIGQIKNMISSGIAPEAIKITVSRDFGISPDLVDYIIRTNME